MAFPKESNEYEGGTMGGPIDDLTDRQKEVFRFIENDTKLTIRKLAKLLNINVSAVQDHITILKEKRIIIRIGGTQGYWKILLDEKDSPKKN